ncbi:hypothetical protein OUZ56_012959 [Daphnia magna]|uniref:Uncharacterized protein n=1 Tax=Daphnia magna TaxID=35525 RepID=A0ABQ9Z4I3_9CRUS|nr:hypothetical protein OUZ56_012959 [Daphnia magna]
MWLQCLNDCFVSDFNSSEQSKPICQPILFNLPLLPLNAEANIDRDWPPARQQGSFMEAPICSEQKLPYGKTHVAIASTHRFNCPATMAIETLEATSKYKKPKSVSIAPTLPYCMQI